MKNQIIKARKLSGFRDFFASDIKIREYVINTFKEVFERYGYEPLETPALEYTEIFAGETGEEAEKLFFKFKDQGGRDVMLKYEVMISMCRAVAENISNIPLPYKRYQIQNVWRAEKPQKGRFREFTQCDADTIGSNSVIWDAEFIQMGIEALTKLGFKKFQASISNRKFLNGLISWAGAKDTDFIPICMSIDKLPKIGKDGVEKELQEKKGINKNVISKILKVITTKDSSDKLIGYFQTMLADNKIAQEGLKELKTIFNYFQTVKLNPKNYRFEPYIARGLAYYTGPIWEFEILDGDVGSVAGCGRYDNTIGRFLGKKIPATGGSFGIERIVEIIKERSMIDTKSSTLKAMVTIFDKNSIQNAIIAADSLRKNDIATMLYSDPNKLEKQLKYADNKNIPFVIIQGPDEAKQNKYILKDMNKKSQTLLTLDQIIKILQE